MNATLPGSSLRDFSRVLSCFAKIGDDVVLEVRPGKLLLSTLNAAKSAFILVSLNATRFERFELQLRALLSIFRPRNIEIKDSRESAVEKCEVKLLHPSEDGTECQLLIRLICKHGVRKTYKLQYETCHTMHAVVDKTTMHNSFTLAGRAWKDVLDHFAPRAEEVTLASEAGNLLLTSFTEGVMNDKQVLKQPIHTSVTVDNKEFDVIDVDDGQITFGLREFKAVGLLCDLLNADVTISFGQAGKPLILEFDKDGMVAEFIVATTDDGERTESIGLERQSASQYRPRRIAAAHAAQKHSSPEPEYARAVPHRDATQDEQDETALFAPDPDEQDESIRAQHARMQNDRSPFDEQDGPTFLQQPSHHDYEEDEMELYADDGEFGIEEEELGPTQTQTINKHKGLFD